MLMALKLVLLGYSRDRHPPQVPGTLPLLLSLLLLGLGLCVLEKSQGDTGPTSFPKPSIGNSPNVTHVMGL